MIIAIDGFSACGKSTLAKALARRINATYIDTGAMYRAVTLYFINKKVDFSSVRELSDVLDEIHISFDSSKGQNDCILNGQNVESKIRSREVSDHVSDIAAIPKVRRKLVELQRQMSKDKDVVMDGRDIGTVVFPKASYKLFITAESEIRAERRLEEYREKGVNISKEEVLANLEKRDRIDSGRADSPLRVAEDALIIDNSNMTKEEQLNFVLELVNAKA